MSSEMELNPRAAEAPIDASAVSANIPDQGMQADEGIRDKQAGGGGADPRKVQPHLVPPHVAAQTWVEYITCAQGPGSLPSNEIRTSKYTILTFLPVNLFLQFTRVANLYFLIISILQLIPQLSPTSWFTTVMPLVFVLAVNAVKEAYDDFKRHRSDGEVNSRKVLVLREGCEVECEWRDVVVGDLVKLVEDREIPADLVFLASSDPDKCCYVETANLDGETDLKVKFCYQPTAAYQSPQDFEDFCGTCLIRCEAPNPHLYSFEGAVSLGSGCSVGEAGSSQAAQERIDLSSPEVTSVRQQPLSIDNFLLRGCTLRKTEWMIGVVVYTGEDTRIMMNRTESPRKVTQLEHHMNILVLGFAAILFFFACMLSAGNQIWSKYYSGPLWYLDDQDEYPDFGPGFPGWAINTIRYIILLNGIIPISLYVTLELVKVLQCVYILNCDLKMYHAKSDTPFACHTTNLNEDLGQVEYVLSDKTGTLTQNLMGFVWLSVGGTLYGKTEVGEGVEGGEDAITHPAHVPEDTAHTVVLDPKLQRGLGPFFQELAYGKKVASSKSARSGNAGVDLELFRLAVHLAVCSTVQPTHHGDGPLIYQSSSPDEEALVQGAAYMGYQLVARASNKVQVAYHGQVWEYETLATLEFNSDRKRMSVVCRCPDGVIRLFCKGADTMIMARVKDGPMMSTVRQHLEEAAVVGYRTLCFAQRELTEEAFQQWMHVYREASCAMDDREGRMAEAGEQMECGMELIGCTAVEDKLQDGVPDAIASLLDAGIKVWVLTGDKVETAISIALSAHLFSSDMSLVEIRNRDFEGAAVDSVLDADEVLEAKIDEVRVEHEAQVAQFPNDANVVAKVGLVVEGGALTAMMAHQLDAKLIRLCSACKSVIFCRVSPLQKALMTKMVKKHMNAITLGIGDGANDVSMIKAAHIGCGISGREGRAAVLAADFSFAQFRYLSRLLLVHGRNSFRRNVETVVYSFYKNWVENLTFVFYAFVSGWSSQPLYTTGLLACFNVFFTSYNIVAYAMLEQDVSASTVLEYPQLYGTTMLSTRRTVLMKQFWYLAVGIWHALVVYFVPMYAMYQPDIDGTPDNLWEVGCTIYFAIIITVNLKLAMRTRFWTWFNHVFLWLAIGSLYLFVYLYGLVWPVAQISGTSNMNEMASRLFSSSRFWLAGCLCAPILSLLLDWIIMAFQQTFFPTMSNIFQEVEQRRAITKKALEDLRLQQGQATPHVSPNDAAWVSSA